MICDFPHVAWLLKVLLHLKFLCRSLTYRFACGCAYVGMAVAEEKRGICWMLMVVVLLVVPGAVFFAIGALGKCMYGTVCRGIQ